MCFNWFLASYFLTPRKIELAHFLQSITCLPNPPFLSLLVPVRLRHNPVHSNNTTRNAPRLMQASCPPSCSRFRGTSVIRNSAPLGRYSRTMPRALWWSQGGSCFSCARCPCRNKRTPLPLAHLRNSQARRDVYTTRDVEPSSRNVARAGQHPTLLQGYLTYKKTHPPYDPTVSLCLGS